VSEPTDDPPFDPYRFGAPEHRVPPEYAPPGFEQTGYNPPVPPPDPVVPPVPPYAAPPSAPVNPYNPGPPANGPYGQPPHGYQPYVQQPPPNQPYGPPSGYPTPPPNYYGYPQPGAGNGKALAGLILGILSCVFFFFTIADAVLIVPGFIFSLMGLSEARRTGVRRGMARWGLTLTIIGTVLAVVLFTIAIVLFGRTDCSVPHKSGSVSERICTARNGN
jgi:hypothetical protein